MSTMSAAVHGFGVSDAYIVKYDRKYLCAKWLAFTLHDRVFALTAALLRVKVGIKSKSGISHVLWCTVNDRSARKCCWQLPFGEQSWKAQTT